MVSTGFATVSGIVAGGMGDSIITQRKGRSRSGGYALRCRCAQRSMEVERIEWD